MLKTFIALSIALLLSCFNVANAGTWGAVQNSASLVAPYPTTVQTASGMNLQALGSYHGHPYWTPLTVGGACVTGSIHRYYVNTVTVTMGATWRGYMSFKKQICT
jgi:hypothetical protein